MHSITDQNISSSSRNDDPEMADLVLMMKRVQKTLFLASSPGLLWKPEYGGNGLHMGYVMLNTMRLQIVVDLVRGWEGARGAESRTAHDR